MIWFTADLHFYHRAVIRYCNRPFSTIEEMNEALIKNWNECVKPDDTIFVLGDFAFCGVNRMREIVSRLNGHKILIKGNHDSSKSRMLKAGFDEVWEPGDTGNSRTLYWAGRKLDMSHYPYAPTKRERLLHKLKNFWKFWRKKKYLDLKYPNLRPEDFGRFLLHGHVHTAWKIKGRMINVGVDQHNYRPVNIKEIAEMINKAKGR